MLEIGSVNRGGGAYFAQRWRFGLEGGESSSYLSIVLSGVQIQVKR